MWPAVLRIGDDLPFKPLLEPCVSQEAASRQGIFGAQPEKAAYMTEACKCGRGRAVVSLAQCSCHGYLGAGRLTLSTRHSDSSSSPSEEPRPRGLKEQQLWACSHSPVPDNIYCEW